MVEKSFSFLHLKGVNLWVKFYKDAIMNNQFCNNPINTRVPTLAHVFRREKTCDIPVQPDCHAVFDKQY